MTAPQTTDSGREGEARPLPVPRPRAGVGEAKRWLAELIASPRPHGQADWPYSVNADGYGKVTWQRRHRRPHAVVLEAGVGPAPVGKPYALHSCDTPGCCALECLRWGDAKENAADAMQRERHCAGERHGRSKVTAAQVREIRALWAEGALNQFEIGALYGISNVAVSAIVTHRRWTDVA